MSVLGLENWGVLVTLNASSLNSQSHALANRETAKGCGVEVEETWSAEGRTAPCLPCTPNGGGLDKR